MRIWLPGDEQLPVRQTRPPSLRDSAGTSAAVRLFHLTRRLRQQPGIGYAAAFVAIGLATLLQWLAGDGFAGAPFLTIYPAIILTTLVGGLGAGFLSAVLSGISQFGLFIPTLHWFALVSYAIDATVCVLLIVFLNTTLELLLVNIDQEKQAKQHQRLLATELHHRIQNLFTVIQAVIRFSLPGDGTIQKSIIKERLADRLQAMSATNRAIVDSMGNGVRLLDLINGAIRGFESRFRITGTHGLVLGPQMTQNLSLILHELLTNSLKYGALSAPDGRVDLRLDWTSWVLTFVWRESNGPAVSPPASSGFGSRILGDFAKSFCRNVDTSYEPTGFCYMLQIHADQNRFAEPAQPVTAAQDAAAGAAAASEPAEVPVLAVLFGQTKIHEPRKEAVLHDWELYRANEEVS
jgi:two-component sensor histidine kinase